MVGISNLLGIKDEMKYYYYYKNDYWINDINLDPWARLRKERGKSKYSFFYFKK